MRDFSDVKSIESIRGAGGKHSALIVLTGNPPCPFCLPLLTPSCLQHTKIFKKKMHNFRCLNLINFEAPEHTRGGGGR